MKAIVNQQDKFELLEMLTQSHEEFLSRAELVKLFSPESPNQKVSPKMTKKDTKSNAKKPQSTSTSIALTDLPSGPFQSTGITAAMTRFLEVAETMATMRDLFVYSHQGDYPGPKAALNTLVNTYQMAQQQHQFNNANLNVAAGMMQGGARTPVMNGFGNSQFASPVHANLNLPMSGSPHTVVHTPSPAMMNMQAPGLAAQHSQQGNNNSTAASSNPSPNISNKRRRPSAVKTEGPEDGAGPNEVNGTAQNKVKASPRVGGKRQKGNPS